VKNKKRIEGARKNLRGQWSPPAPPPGTTRAYSGYSSILKDNKIIGGVVLTSLGHKYLGMSCRTTGSIYFCISGWASSTRHRNQTWVRLWNMLSGSRWNWLVHRSAWVFFINWICSRQICLNRGLSTKKLYTIKLYYTIKIIKKISINKKRRNNFFWHKKENRLQVLFQSDNWLIIWSATDSGRPEKTFNETFFIFIIPQIRYDFINFF
jgi:hypothetical protein